MIPALLFVMMIGSVCFAQTTGKIAGRVTDENGEPLAFANVLIQSTSTGAATDIDGYYSIINVRAGKYVLEFKYLGYQTKVVTNVEVNADQTKTINVQLKPTTIKGEVVTIVAKKPLVQLNITSSVNSLSKDDIKNLPVQSVDDIVNLQAGVVDGHFRGGRIGEVQYQVDGVSINNPYDNSATLNLDRSSLEEIQVISGTFDAKYGQAMSGVVNAVLKSGSDNFEVSGESYLGDYFTTDTERYPHTDNYNPTRIQNYQLSLSGPLVFNTTFFVNGRRFLNDGYFFGERRFLPTDSSNFETREFDPTGDGAIVPMATTDQWNVQFKVANRSIPDVVITYQLTYDNLLRKFYNHAFRFNPDGVKPNKTISINHGLGITHSLSNKMFYKLNFRQNYFDFKDLMYDNLFDPRYIEAGQPMGDPNYEDGAIVQGVELGRFIQNTNSFIAKGDFTWQFDRANLIESGLNFSYHDVKFGSPGYILPTIVDGQQVLLPQLNAPRLPGVQRYFPNQLAAYLQDRIEIGDLVIRAGLRFEYFNAKATIPSDLQNPANSISGAPLSHPQKTTIKTALAPRLGFSFPISSTASTYFSYGHFYQMPALGLLYNNSNYDLLDDLQAGGVSYGVMGNPDLDYELTVQYEFGLKQAFGNILGAQLSLFYKDIKSLLGVEFVDTYSAAQYARFTNVDFGNSYGFTLSLTQRNIGYLSASVDYTLMISEGNSSDPRETANRAAAGKDPRPRNIPFNWDQLHTLNATIIYSIPNDISLSAILRFGSGQPYTPEIGTGFGADLETNSGRKSNFTILDLRAEKFFNFGSLNFSLFIRVFNALNANFVNGFVFASTGSPDYTLTPSTARALLHDPSRFYEPRRIEFGISFRTY